MHVFAAAEELLGDIPLTAGELGQLRAPEYRFLPDPGSREPASLSPREEADLRARIVEEIMQVLTPEQRARVARR